MRILVTNDDGILAPGIVALAEAMKEFGEVIVIAPDRNNSGVSSAISLETPLRVTEIKSNWFQLNGTPADCAKLALSGFLKQEPDMVVSGINAGQNLGDDVIYSGTVGAAIEGRYLGLPSLAFSLASHGDTTMHYDTAAKAAKIIMRRLLKHKLQGGLALNINVPNISFDQINGFQATRQGERYFSEPLKPTFDGRNKEIYWLGEAGKVRDGTHGTDFHAVSSNYVSIMPIQIDLTDHGKINLIDQWLCEAI